MKLPFAGAVLDLDGLLLDTERLRFEVGPEVFRALGHDLPESFFRSVVGVDRYATAELATAATGNAFDGDALEDFWNAAMDARMADGIPLRPGVHDFFDALDRWKLPRAIATNSIGPRAEAKLRMSGLFGRVDAVVGVDMVARGKPAPDVYIEAARRIGLPPGQCIALDDSDLGVRAAVDAGIMTVIQIPDMAESVELRAHHQAVSLSEATRLLGLDRTPPATEAAE